MLLTRIPTAASLSPSCRLKGLFDTALRAYFRELDGKTLADIIAPAASRNAPRSAVLAA